MAMTLPAVLLLLDLYPLRRIRSGVPLLPQIWSLVREKLAFFALSFVIAVISLIVHDYGGALPSLHTMTLTTRLLNACHSLVYYLQTMVVPMGLAPFYPYPEWVLEGSWQSWVAPLLVVAVTALSIVAWARGRRVWLVAWLYYVGTLIPVIGIVQAGAQAAADRYTYLPTLSAYLLVAVGAAQLWSSAQRRAGSRIAAAAAIALIVVALAWATRQQAAIWRTDETLWQTVVARFPDQVPAAYHNLGSYYFVNGDAARAVEMFRKGLELEPRFAALRLNLGYAFEQQGELALAVAEYGRAAVDSPRSVRINVRVGDAMLRLGRLDEALVHFQTALALEPGSPHILTRLGQANFRAGRLTEAEKHARRALRASSDHLQASLLLAVTLHAQGKTAQAAQSYRRVLALDPGNRDARLNLETLAPLGK